MAYVNTTFLPKTNGMVFGDRLVARSAKGRVFGLEGSTPTPPLEVAENGGANLVATNVYEIGQVVTGKTAVFTGGNPDTTAYRSRWQSRPTASDAWVNSSWMNTTNAKNDHQYSITSAGQIRFQSQARDTSDDPVTQVNSFTSVKDVPFQTFGTFSMTPGDSALSSGSTQAFTSSFDGDATNVTYSWSVRSGSATLQSGQGTSSATYLFVDPGAVQIQCTATSSNASDSPVSFVSMVVVT